MSKKDTRHIVSLMRLIKCRMTNKSSPLFTALGITARCNYKCIYCYGDYYNKREEKFSTGELIEIIDTLRDMGCCVVNLIGGEPFLRNDIGILIKQIKTNRMICHVSTNGSLLEEKIDLARSVDALDISLDGMEESNDKNRGKNTFRQTLGGIRCAVKNKLTTNVNMVLTKHNLGDIAPMVKLAVDTGFILSFNIVFESHSCEHNNFEDSRRIKSKNDILVKRALKEIMEYKKRGYPVRFSTNAYQYALDWPRSYSEKVYIPKDEPIGAFRPIPCYFSRFHCYIDTDGRIHNCMHIKDDMPVINVKELGLKKAWNRISSHEIPCRACYTICNNDANLIFGLKPSALFSFALDHIKRRKM